MFTMLVVSLEHTWTYRYIADSDIEFEILFNKF